MRTLALLGGMSHSATSIYYTQINTFVHRRLGGANSATLLLHSFNHADMTTLFLASAWPEVTSVFVRAATALKSAGASGVVICCNIGHKVADDVERLSGLPVLHTADFTAARIKASTSSPVIDKVLLLGTRQVMEEPFLKDRLQQKAGLAEVMVPSDPGQRERIQDMIFNELGVGVMGTPSQKELMWGVIEDARKRGAKGVVFACTELRFVVDPAELEGKGVPVWDTLEGHALGAAEWMLEGEDEQKSNGD